MLNFLPIPGGGQMPPLPPASPVDAYVHVPYITNTMYFVFDERYYREECICDIQYVQ